MAPVADIAAGHPPQQQAAADAAAMLAAFIPPPDAVRTGRLPVSWLAQPVSEPLITNLVTRTGWWRVASLPPAVLGWIQDRRPPGSAFFGGGNGTGGITHGGVGVMWFTEFTWPSVPGVLVGRELVASVAADGPGSTAIRVDAYVVWLSARPSAEAIPAGATVVTITPVAGEAADHQATVTDPARVARPGRIADSGNTRRSPWPGHQPLAAPGPQYQGHEPG